MPFHFLLFSYVPFLMYLHKLFLGAFTGLSIYAGGSNSTAAKFRGDIKLTEGLFNLHEKFTMDVNSGVLNIAPTNSSSQPFKFFDDGKLELRRLDATEEIKINNQFTIKTVSGTLNITSNSSSQPFKFHSDGKLEVRRLDALEIIYAKEVHVKQPSAFPDYVFADDYDLQPLDEVKAFIEEHKHLPNYPSAQEVATNGIGVGELQIKQMETIEELMLYVIELKEQMKKLEAKVEQMDENKNNDNFIIMNGAKVKCISEECEPELQDDISTHSLSESLDNESSLSNSFSYQKTINEKTINELIIKENVLIFDGKEILFEVFPNPSSGKFNVLLEDISFDKIKAFVSNNRGEILYEKNFINEKNFEIDMFAQPAGIYYLLIYIDNEIFVKRLVKK